MFLWEKMWEGGVERGRKVEGEVERMRVEVEALTVEIV